MTKVFGLILAAILVLALMLTSLGCSKTSVTTPTPPPASEVPYKNLVEDFVKNDATWAYDGIDGSMKIVNTIGSAVGNTPAKDWEFTVEYQTRHPGHGDRTGQVLAQAIAIHSAVIKVKDGQILSATCDNTWDMLNDKRWDMVNEKNPPASVTGTVIGGGDTSRPYGPLDVPKTFRYQVRKSDGTLVNVQYTGYPPSPVADAQRKKITLDFNNGSIAVGDTMEASGTLDQLTNTITVADQGDYIKTYSPASATPAPVQPLSEEVSWSIGETIVTATVTRPNDKGIHPAVVFVAGSGPTDRDWNSPLLPGTNGSARLLAEELAKKGFVTIRYDKRVTGPNAQKNIPLLVGKISMAGHQEELAGAVNLLVAQSDVNAKQIYVLANSEGTIHALNYQLTGKPQFAGLILTGLPGRNMADVMRGQLSAQVAALPNAKEIMAGYDKLMADFLAGKPFVADKSLPDGINQLVQSFSIPVNLPFTRELFTTDAAPLLGKMTAPVMVMIGKKDVQVDYQLDGQPLENAVKGMNNITFIYPETANHVLKFESRPRSALTGADALTYNASDRVLDPDALKIILGWLEKTLAR